MMPLWVHTLGNFIYEKPVVPYDYLFYSLLWITVPFTIGVIIQKLKPNWNVHIYKVIKPFSIVCVVIGIIGELVTSTYVFKLYDWEAIGAGICISWLSFLIGALIALALKLHNIIAVVSVETTIQNHTIALALLQYTFEHPDSELASVPIFCQIIVTSPPMWLIFFAYMTEASKKFKSKLVSRNVPSIQIHRVSDM